MGWTKSRQEGSNMRLTNLAFFAAFVALVLVFPGSAAAQGLYQGRADNPNGPTVSPYLNLLQTSPNNPITNYQSLVKPLVNQGAAIQRQGRALAGLQQQVYAGAGAGLATGHRSYFMNFSHFYPSGTGR
jgi:hypothetical protein